MAKARDNAIFEYLLRLGDNCLILGQRNSEWCGHGPALEEDIALANIALDYIGQTRLWYELAGQIEGKERTPDDFAYTRDAFDFRNVLMVERPNGDFGTTLVRQFLFDAWYFPTLQALTHSADHRIAEVAEKCLREVAYHLERSSDLVIRLGDGTAESHSRLQAALEDMWPYAEELHQADELEMELARAAVAPEPELIYDKWNAHVNQTLHTATLKRPEGGYVQSGGKRGVHTEHMGYLLAEMQFLQRAYPGAEW